MSQEGLLHGPHYNLRTKEIRNIIKENMACMNIQ